MKASATTQTSPIAFGAALVLLVLILIHALYQKSQAHISAKTQLNAALAVADSAESHLIPDIWIVNMADSTQRLDYVAAHLRSFNITRFERFPATEGKKVGMDVMRQHRLLQSCTMSPAHTGCAHSHFSVMEKIAALDSDTQDILVLEDDVILHPMFVQLYAYYKYLTPKDFNILYLSTCGVPLLPTDTHVKECGATTTAAYVMNKRGAQYILDNCPPLVDIPIDCVLHTYFNSYGSGSFVVNGNAHVLQQGIRPNQYMMERQAMLFGEGIIYQNRGTFESIIG